MQLRIIANGRATPDDWQLLEATNGPAKPAAGQRVILPLALWLDLRGRRSLPDAVAVGVCLDGGDDPAVLGPALPMLPLIAVRFASFRDGRGYSIARRLRLHHGYHGELRAVGDVLADQLYLMARCGFDSFALRADQDPDTAVQALTAFSGHYQRGYARADRPDAATVAA